MKRSAKFFGAVSLALAASLAACASGKVSGTDSVPLKIYLLQDGRCQVGAKQLACADIRSYMRDELKLDRGVHCAIDASAAPSYEAVQSLVEALRGSGCKVGSVNASKS